MITEKRRLWIGSLVHATVCDEMLAYHRTQRRYAMGCLEYAWTITHVETRKAIAVTSTWQRARKAIERLLNAGIDWCKAVNNEQERERAKQLVDSLVAEGILTAMAKDAGFPYE